MPPPRQRKRRRRSSPYFVWLGGLFLSYGTIGATLFAFQPPWWIWIIVCISVLALINAWEEVGIFALASAIVIGMNWTLDSNLGFLAELLLSTLIAVLMAGAVALLMAESRIQLQAAFENPNCVFILLGVSVAGLGIGSLVGLALPL